MVDQKLSLIPATASPVRGDLLYTVTTPLTNPTSRSLALEYLLQGTQGIMVAAVDAPDSWKKGAKYVCDGVHDEIEIQAAIDELIGTNGIVRCSPGIFNLYYVGVETSLTYLCNYSVKILNTHGSVSVLGAGWGLTKFRLADNQTKNTVALLILGKNDTTGKRLSPTLIEGIEIDGNTANQPHADTEGNLTQLLYSNYVTFENLYIHGQETPSATQVLRNSQFFKALHCIYKNGGSNCEGLRIESPYSEVSGCTFDFSSGTTGTLLDFVANQDISVQSSDALVSGCLFLGGVSQLGLATSRVTVVGNTFKDYLYPNGFATTIFGIANYPANDVKIIGNSFYNIRQGIYLNISTTGQCNRNIIANNTIIEGTGISLANGIVVNHAQVSNTQLLYNIIQGATTAVTDNGTNTVNVGTVIL